MKKSIILTRFRANYYYKDLRIACADGILEMLGWCPRKIRLVLGRGKHSLAFKGEASYIDGKYTQIYNSAATLGRSVKKFGIHKYKS
jgi:hypothetical protein